MFRNYIKYAWRNLRKDQVFSLINLAGLALGISVFLLITEFVASEWNANRFNKKYDTLYRLDLKHQDGIAESVLVPGIAPLIKQSQPDILNFTRVADGLATGVITVQDTKSTGNTTFREEKMVYADDGFFKMFSFPILSGTASLNAPKSIAISQKLALKVFDRQNAVGRVLTISNQFGNTAYTISAVYQIPKSSDIAPEAVLSLNTLESPANRSSNDWADPKNLNNGLTNIYFELKRDADLPKITASISSQLRSLNYYPGAKTDLPYLHQFKELHLAPNFSYPYQTYGNLFLVVVFTGIGLLILIIAWLNYINLTTAQALTRAKEVGVRKVLGAKRLQLVFQYLTETLLLTAASMGSALCMVQISQPMINRLTGKELYLADLNSGFFWLGGLLMIVLGSVISGGYTAFVLSSFTSPKSLSSHSQATVGSLSLRKVLVVFQFTASIIFIVATAILYKQLQFMQNGNLGMNLKQLLVIKGPTVATDNQMARNLSFKNSLSQLPFITKYAASNNVPGMGFNFSADGITRMNAPEQDKKNAFTMFICDEHFFDTYNISLKQGSGFNANDAEQTWNQVKKVVINEKAARVLGFDPEQNLVGQKINWGAPFEIIGVVKDYHHMSLRSEISPTIYLASVSTGFFTVQTEVKDMQVKLAALRKLYNQNFPGNPFEYFFADEQYNQQYQSEQRLGKIFIAAALIAVFIACLGLFGLAAFSAKQRTKEIGIRKVLGASVFGIASLLSRDFVKLILIALLIASPIAYLAMQKWLQNFANQTQINWWIFLAVGIGTIAIALCTISFQAVKAALANPVKSLRSE